MCLAANGCTLVYLGELVLVELLAALYLLLLRCILGICAMSRVALRFLSLGVMLFRRLEDFLCVRIMALRRPALHDPLLAAAIMRGASSVLPPSPP